MAIIDKIKAKARADVKRIVLPEGEEPRTIRAAAKILEDGARDRKSAGGARCSQKAGLPDHRVCAGRRALLRGDAQVR